MEGLMILTMSIGFSLFVSRGSIKESIILIILSLIPLLFALVAINTVIGWAVTCLIYTTVTIIPAMRASDGSKEAGILYALVVMTNATLECITLGIWTW